MTFRRPGMTRDRRAGTARRGEVLPTQFAGLSIWLSGRSGVLASGGGPATNGGAVATWRDLSGNGKNVAANASGVLYTASVAAANMRPGVTFDGTDFMSLAGYGPYAQPRTRVVVCQITASSTDVVVDGIAQRNACYYNSGSTRYDMFAGVGLGGPGVSVNELVILAILFNGGASKIRAITGDTDSTVSGGDGSSAMEGIAVGIGNDLTSNPFHGHLFEVSEWNVNNFGQLNPLLASFKKRYGMM